MKKVFLDIYEWVRYYFLEFLDIVKDYLVNFFSRSKERIYEDLTAIISMFGMILISFKFPLLGFIFLVIGSITMIIYTKMTDQKSLNKLAWFYLVIDLWGVISWWMK